MVRQEVVELEHEADLPVAVHVELGEGAAMEEPTVHLHRAFRRRLERAEDVEERRLSRSRLAEQRDGLPRADVEIRSAEHVDPVAPFVEGAAQPANLERDPHHSYRSPSTGSIEAARHAGYRVAKKHVTSAPTTTVTTLACSTTTGSESR